MSEAVSTNRLVFEYDSEDEAFPKVDPLQLPFGSRVLVQIRMPKKKTKSGLFLAVETRDTENWTTQIAKVIALGPVAFCDRKTLEPWPEGRWCKPGDFVRVPRYGGDSWTIPAEGFDEEVRFMFFNDLDLGGYIPGGFEDAMKIKAFI
jgi:co-chaperonin GroES (HSP10)